MRGLGAARAVQHRVVEFRRRRGIDAILSNPALPDTSAAERDFAILQAAYPPLPEYGYDRVSLLRRAAGRVSDVFAGVPEREEPLKLLDIGAGDGTLGAIVASGGYDVTLCDLRDWRHPHAAHLKFVEADSQALPFPAGAFDILTSFNAFEHMADPGVALAEMIRVTRPGGRIHLDFNPLYYSPWGLHAYRTLRMPYPQLLFSPAFVKAKLALLGINDLGEARFELQFVNEWRVEQYARLWRDNDEIADVSETRALIYDHLDLVRRYPRSFAGRGLGYEDLITAGIRVVLIRRS